MGEGWGGNGARLALPLEIVADAKTSAGEEGSSVKTAWLGGRPTGSVECRPRTTLDRAKYHTSYMVGFRDP